MYDFEGEQPPYCDLCGWFHFFDCDPFEFDDEYPDIDEED